MGSSVEISHWSYRYPLNDTWAVDDLSLSVAAGEKILLTGRSGWGKSTVLQGITGILGDVEDGGDVRGTISVDGVPAIQARGRVGLILQDPESQIVFARVIDNATFGAENLGVERDEIIRRAQLALHTVDVDPAHGIEPARLAQQLSGGQTQRLAVASIMAMQPDVIVCDEPTANLDPDGIERVISSIVQAAQSTGATLIVVDHNVEQWLPFMDRHVTLGEPIALEEYAGLYAPAQLNSHGEKRSDALQQQNSYEADSDDEVLVNNRTALYTDNLCFGYANEQVSYPFTHSFDAGTITALTGVNGAGKTTLSLTLAGLLPALSGHVRVSDAVRGVISSAEPSQWSTSQLAQRIQYVFQNPEHQFVTNSVRDEMMSALRISHSDMDEAALNALAQERLEYYNLISQINHNPYSLSGGQKRRLTVACAIEAQPHILIVDEPTYGQDPQTWLALVRMFAQLRDSGTCIITVTHDRAFIDALGAREIVIEANPDSYSDKKVRNESQSAFVASLNPMTRLFTGLLVGLPLIFSLDIVSSSLALLLSLIVIFGVGFTPRTVLKYTWPILVGAIGSFITVAVYNKDHNLMLATATSIRVLAMSAPAVVLVMRMDPTDLADAFVQKLKLSDRFVYAALAGFRLLPLLRVDMESIHQARRIRGIQSQSRIEKYKNDALNLLVLAIRRSTMLAIVMQARAFGAPFKRTNVRLSLMHWRDYIAFGISILIPIIALIAAYYMGALNLFGQFV
ncbi:ATP-binding cassette domain-containing protein [Alloscardovia omnicolens]|uniref:ATP-binding cassette domain-containing protein n=1 Tax=Alloscardovia omnicolens TaxID=419015 RepID=UPI003A6461E6